MDTTTTTATTVIVENQPDTPVVNPGLPSSFIRLDSIHCAYRCDYLDWPHCFGCKGATQFLCVEDEHYICKCPPPNNEQNVCFLLASGVSDLTQPELRCKLYRQCFCVELVCGFPLDESMLQPGDMLRNVESKEGLSNVYDAVPCNAACCFFDSCFCSFPACCGCVRRQQCLCVDIAAIYMKPLCWEKERENPRSCCLLGKSKAVCFSKPTTCIKCMDQTFCIDRRCAIPCDEEVPCLCTCLPFCVCCVQGECKMSCCMSVGQLTGRGAKAPVPPPLTEETMAVHNITHPPLHGKEVQVVYVQQPPQGAPQPVQYVMTAPGQRGANAPVPPAPTDETMAVHNVVHSHPPSVQMVYVQQPPQGAPQPVQYVMGTPGQRGDNASVPPTPTDQTMAVHNVAPSPPPVQMVYVQQPPQAAPQPVQYVMATPGQPTYAYAQSAVLNSNAPAPPVKDPNMV